MLYRFLSRLEVLAKTWTGNLAKFLSNGLWADVEIRKQENIFILIRIECSSPNMFRRYRYRYRYNFCIFMYLRLSLPDIYVVNIRFMLSTACCF